MIKRELAGTPQFFGDETFLKFGNELHKRQFKPEEKKDRLSLEEEQLLKRMLRKLALYKPLVDFMKGAKNEIKTVKPVWNIGYAKVILDTRKGKKARDLKSTSTTTYEAFEKSAFKYDYFRQAALYMEAEQLDEFIFDGISKKGDNRIFSLNVRDYSSALRDGMEEAKHLMHIHYSIKKYVHHNSLLLGNY